MIASERPPTAADVTIAGSRTPRSGGDAEPIIRSAGSRSPRVEAGLGGEIRGSAAHALDAICMVAGAMFARMSCVGYCEQCFTIALFCVIPWRIEMITMFTRPDIRQVKEDI